MKKVLSLIIIASSFFSSTAQTEIHPIDVRNSACHNIAENQTTVGMVDCENTAREEWTLELNKYYQLLLDTLSPASATTLESSQKQWLEYVEKENSFANTLYYEEMDGTMWYVINAGRLKDIVRTRAMELKEYYEMYTIE